MSLIAIALRALVAYIVLLALVRASGTRLVSEATGMQFVLAVIVPDATLDQRVAGSTPARPILFAR